MATAHLIGGPRCGLEDIVPDGLDPYYIPVPETPTSSFLAQQPVEPVVLARRVLVYRLGKPMGYNRWRYHFTGEQVRT